MLLVICQLGRDVISYERVHKEVLFELHWTQYMDWVWLSSITISLIDKGKYWKVPMVATLVTFGISNLWGSNISGCRYSPGVIIFRDKKP